MSAFKTLNLLQFSDERGSLTVVDKILPFSISRVYWIYGADGYTRGGHRHHVTHQALIAIAGTVHVTMCDGLNTEKIVLNNPNKCLIVEPKDWHDMFFSDDAVLLVLASHPFDPCDYIDTPYE